MEPTPKIIKVVIFSFRNTTAKPKENKVSMLTKGATMEAPNLSTPLYERILAIPGANIPANTKYHIPGPVKITWDVMITNVKKNATFTDRETTAATVGYGFAPNPRLMKIFARPRKKAAANARNTLSIIGIFF
jgi:hypothetical protein